MVQKVGMSMLLLLVAGTAVFAGDGHIRRVERQIKDQYLVLLDPAWPADGVATLARSLAESHQGRVRRVMNSAVNGFSIELSQSQATLLAHHPAVLLVEENGHMELAATRSTPEPLWNLDRLDQRAAVTTGDDLYRYCEDGNGGIAYVVDSGVREDHIEFRTGLVSRVLPGACMEPSCANAGRSPCAGSTPTLNGGHGTAVASVLAGNTVGVASASSIVPVQVVNCAGTVTSEWVATGLDWIRSYSNPHRDVRPAVVNMSLFLRYITGYQCQNPTGTETSCTDDVDNDCDGFVDAGDVSALNLMRRGVDINRVTKITSDRHKRNAIAQRYRGARLICSRYGTLPSRIRARCPANRDYPSR